MKRGEIIIPKSELDQKLAEAAAIRKTMTELLRELEESATGKKIEKIGQWRQNPHEWMKKNKN